MSSVELVVSTFAVVFTVSFAWPQVFRAFRHGVEGISPSALIQSLLSATTWLAYGVARDLGAVVIADAGVVLGQLTVLVLLTRARAVKTPFAVAVVGVGFVLFALTQVDALTTPMVALAGIVGLTSAATQLLEVVREPDALEGLSAGTYLLLTMLAACWLGFGVIVSDPAIIIPNIVMIPMAGYIAFMAWRSHQMSELVPATT